MNFTFGMGPQIIFGQGESQKIGEIVKGLKAKKVLAIYDQGIKSVGIVDKILDSLKEAELVITEFGGVEANPADTIIEKAGEIGRHAEVDVVVAIGGGSSMDAAKAINILLTNPSPINRYEDFSISKNPTKPLICIPTTSGTGSEVTGVSVITNVKEKRKFVVGGLEVFPSIALVDPELTYTLPASITADTGMDALTHAIEAYLSLGRNILTDQFALKSVQLIFNNLQLAYENGENEKARENLMLGSMMAGTALTNASLGLVHAIAHPLSALHHIPHGAANAIALAHAIEYNAESVPEKVKECGIAMGLELEELEAVKASKIVVEELKKLVEKLNIPSLKDFGIKTEQLEILAEAILNEKMALMTNPREIDKEAVLDLLKKMY